MARENIKQYYNDLLVVQDALRLLYRLHRELNVLINKNDEDTLFKAFDIINNELDNAKTLLEVT